MKKFAGLLLALALFSGNSAHAQNCNSPSGFIKVVGPINIGDNVVLGPDCQSVQSGQGSTGIVATQQIFATISAFANAVIPANISVVTTLGYSFAGDNGGADYVRIAPNAVKLWRVRSLDGQWWAINNRTVTPEMFACFSGIDCTTSFQAIAEWLMQFTGVGSDRGGITINFTPRASYKVWPAGTTPSPLFDTIGIHGLTVNYNGAEITTDNIFAPQGSPYVWRFGQPASDITINDPTYRQSGYLTPLDFTRGATHLNFSGPGIVNVKVSNLKQIGGVLGLAVGDAIGVAAPSRGFELINAQYDSVYYPMNFQNGGDQFFARGVNCVNSARCYFAYGINNHDVEIVSDGSHAAHDNILVKQYANPNASIERNTISDITIRYKNSGQTLANNSPSLATFEMQQVVAPMVVTNATNNAGFVRLTVDTTANAASGQTWFCNGIGGTTEANGRFVISVAGPTLIDLPVAFANPYTAGGYCNVPAAAKNIHFIFDVNDTTGNGFPPALLTRKWLDTTTIDTATRGYIIDNLTVSGTIKNYNTGTSALTLFNNSALPGAAGIWTGETIRNVRLHDLHVGGTNSSVIIDATALTSAMIENVNSPAAVPWTVTDPSGVVRPTNTTITGVTNRQAVIPSVAVANQYVTGMTNGALLRAQPSFSDLLGSLTCAQTPALTGDISTSAGSCITAIGAGKVLTGMIGNNAVDNTKFRQGVARSVVGVTGNATSNVADIQGTASQWLGINAAGTGLSFQTLGGDCTGAIPSIVCTKTNGVAFAASATTDTTNATNISSGTLAGARYAAANLASSANGGVTGVLPVANGGWGDAGVAWTNYTPTVTAGSGTITTLGVRNGYYKIVGKTMFINTITNVTTAGTASGDLCVSLPSGSARNDTVIPGKEFAITGSTINAFVSAGNAAICARYYNSAVIWADGIKAVISGVLELN